MMTKLTRLLMAICLFATPLAAYSESPQIEVMRRCGTEAGNRVGKERKLFMRSCLSGKPISSTTDNSNGSYIFAEKQKNDCSQGSQVSMNECMVQELAKADQELNDIYAELMRISHRPKGIRAAQRAWLHFRDAECSSEVLQARESDSPYPYLRDVCLIELTQERTRHLRWHLAH